MLARPFAISRVVLLSAVSLMLASSATAQSGSRGFSLGADEAGSGGGSKSSAASTVAQGVLQGQAALQQAAGASALSRAQAAVTFEQARREYLENRLQAIDYHARRQAAREERRQASLAEKAARLSMRRSHRRVSQRGIEWPDALSGPRYANLRAEVEGLLALKNRLGNNASGATQAALQATLRTIAKRVVADARARRINRDEFELVKQFVRGLPERSPATVAPLDRHHKQTMLAMSDDEMP